MGIDITGFSKARRIVGRHPDETCDEEEHYPVSDRKLFDGGKPGCYVEDGRRYYFGISYAGFDTWQNALSLIFHNVPASEVQDHQKRLKGQPFVDMIAFPVSNDVGIGPKTAATLFNDFSKHATKAKNGFQRLSAEAAAQRSKRKKRPAKSRSYTANQAYSLTKALGGMTVGGDDDPESVAWKWKWQLYRDFRRALKLACDDGLVLVSI
jgi:hypothetical protein